MDLVLKWMIKVLNEAVNAPKECCLVHPLHFSEK